MLTHDHVCLNLLWPFVIKDTEPNKNELSWDNMDDPVDLTLVDVGSANGDFAKLFMNSVPTRYNVMMYGFEPNPTIDVHQELITSAQYSRHRLALGSQQGKTTIKVPTKLGQNRSNTHCSSLHHLSIFDTWDDSRIIEYDTDIITLDYFSQKNNLDKIHYMKVDVEGWELEVFKGAKNLFNQGKITSGHFEYVLSVLQDTNQKLEDILNYFNKNNYSCFWGRPGIDTPMTAINCKQILSGSPDQWENILFVRNDLLS